MNHILLSSSLRPALRLGGALLLALLHSAAQAALPVQTWTHAGGARVFLVESHAIPMVDVELDFDAGSRRDPADKAGLAGVTADLAGKGIAARPGEPGLDENAVSEAWADLGATFGASASLDRMSFRLRSLNYPDLLGKAAALAARQLAFPAFPEDIWRRDRERMIASLREDLTKPATVAGRAFAQAVYGNHPYGYQMTEASLGRIAVSDMAQAYAAMIEPCRARISVVGAVTRAQAEALVTTLLSGLQARAPGRCDPLPAVPEVEPLAQASTREIPFDSAQAHVLVGQPGYKRDDPDFFALLVGNHILGGGGGLISRLADQVREKRGLAYSVDSDFMPGRHAGAFTLGLQTRADQAGQALKLARSVLEDYVAKGPTEAEIRDAKANLIGGFALRIDSNRKLLGMLANIAWNDLPVNYMDTWTRQVEKVTREQVKAAMARKLQPQRMVTVVVGGQAAKAP